MPGPPCAWQVVIDNAQNSKMSLAWTTNQNCKSSLMSCIAKQQQRMYLYLHKEKFNSCGSLTERWQKPIPLIAKKDNTWVERWRLGRVLLLGSQVEFLNNQAWMAYYAKKDKSNSFKQCEQIQGREKFNCCDRCLEQGECTLYNVHVLVRDYLR